MGKPEVNVLVGGPIGGVAPCQYKTKILKANLPFKGQVENDPNTKFVIKWDFGLKGQSVTIPENCILEFDGGMLDNGTVTGQDTVYINVGDIEVWGLHLVRKGTWKKWGGGEFHVDDHLSTTSENPVQNMIVTRELHSRYTKDETYAKSEVYKKSEVYNKNEVYPKAELYTKDDLYNKNEVYNKSQVYNKSSVYNKEETNNIISRTPETDVVVLDVPEGSTAADVLDEVPVADRPNKLFRLRNDANTHFDEYGWTGTEWALLASKDYGIDDVLDGFSTNENVPSSAAVIREVMALNPSIQVKVVNGHLSLGDDGRLSLSESSKTLVVLLNGNEHIEMQAAVSTAYACFASTFNFSNLSFTRVSWLDDDREIQSNSDTPYVCNLGDGEHDGAKYMLITVELNGSDRHLKYLYIDGKNLAYSIQEQINKTNEQLEQITLGLETKEDKVKFNNIVGEGFKSSIEFVSTTPDLDDDPDRIFSKTDSLFLRKGDSVSWNIFMYTSAQYGENNRIYFQASTRPLNNWRDTSNPDVIAFERQTDNGYREHTGSYVATQDCYVKFKGLRPSVAHPEFDSVAVLCKTITNIVKVNIDRGYVSGFNLSHIAVNQETGAVSPSETPYVMLHTDEIDKEILGGCIVKVRDEVYGHVLIPAKYNSEGELISNPRIEDVIETPPLFIYYYTATRQESTEVYGSGLCIAYSEDGFHWTRGFPEGFSPIATNVPAEVGVNNFLFPLTYDEDTNKYYQSEYIGANVVKVDDPEYPYRMILNVGIDSVYYEWMYMMKSRDGIHFDYEHAKQISGLHYDSDFSVIPYGNIIKVYVRMRDSYATYRHERQIGIMFIDLEGNIVTAATTLFGEGLYNSAGFKIDDRRELLLPTEWTCYERVNGDIVHHSDEDLCYFRSFIVDGETIKKSTPINGILKVAGEGTQWEYAGINMDGCWGAVNPGFILIDGDIYLTYNLKNYSHSKLSSNPPEGVEDYYETRIVKLAWTVQGHAVRD